MEIIRYTPVGKEDLNLGTGTFEVRLADGRVVTMNKVDIGALLNDATISTQALTLTNLILTTLTVSGAVTFSGSLTLGAATVSGAIGLSSGQITYPTAQNASADAHTLDDYEEFSWTPSVGGTATYTSRSGQGIKIGGGVFFRGFMTINAIGTGSTSTIQGLPTDMIATADSPVSISNTANLAVAVTSIGGYVGSSTNPVTIYLLSRIAAATSDTAYGILGSGSQITVGGWYPVV